MTNSISNVKNCAGCSACGDVCPKKAIKYVLHKDGFYYPMINKDKCVNCGLCLKVCPKVNKVSTKPIEGFACYSLNNDIYMNSSSGGVFAELAKKVLQDGGIVYGAAFNGLKVEHMRICSISELDKLQKSKYIQSDTRGIFTECLKDLNDGKMVLFSGVPCQVSALNNFIKTQRNNLITCDLICHGVPSQQRFNEFIDVENKRKAGVITEFQFRKKLKKNCSTQTFYYKIKRKNKIEKVTGNYFDFPYLMGYQKYMYLRDSCYCCNYANMERCSDITLGDYWEKAYVLNKPKGISMVIVNTNKGLKLFNSIRNSLYCEKVDLKELQQANECLNNPSKPNAKKDEFDKLYANDKEDAIKKFLTPRKKFGLKVYYALPFAIKRLIKRIVNKNKLKKMW